MMQHIVYVFLAVLDQLFHSEFFHLFVLAMQFLKSQSYATNAGLVRIFRG